MKKIFLIATTAAVIVSCSSPKQRTSGFELKGTLTNSNGETIYFEKLTPQKSEPVDSCVIDANGNFSFTNYVPLMGFYRIKLSNQNFAMVVVDSVDKVTVTGNAKDLGNSYKVTGSPETILFLEYNELAKANRNRIDSLQQAFQFEVQDRKLDSLGRDTVGKRYEAIFNKIVDQYGVVVAEKIKTNTTMFSSIMALQPLDPEKYSTIFKALDEGLMKKYPDNDNVRMFHQMISKTFATAKGGAAPEINMPTPEGPSLALSSLRGKIVLIDFWASWCGPCRKEMPHVKEIYAKYKSKGLEIYGVSLDKEKGAWLEAIKKDGLTWPQVSDLKFWQSDAVPLYDIQSIPHTVILDREGKIIAKGVRGEELDKLLRDIFAEKPNEAHGPGDGHNHEGHNHS